jgi:lipopolysaccharide transport system permease protein
VIARFLHWQATVSGDRSRIHIETTLRHAGREPWSGEQGDALSYLLLDAATGNLITEGQRRPFPARVEPGSSLKLTISCDVPAAPGLYRIHVSPVREGVTWFHEAGSPFLSLEIEVTEAEVRVLGGAVTTARRQRWKRALQAVGRAFVYPVRTMIRHRSLIRSMVRRDIVGRYRGSYGGLFWTVIHPLLMMLTYYFVFGIVLRTRFGDTDDPSNFPLYFLAGMLPWLAFAEAVGRAPTTVWEHGNFVRKLLFPVETLPVNLVMAGLFSEVFGVGIFLAGMMFFGRDLPLTALYLPLVLIPQFLLTLGVSWFLAALGVFFRDLGQIIGFLVTVWFFITPICYPQASLPPDMLWLFEKNPMYTLVESYRAIFLEASPPPWQALAVLTGVSAVIFVLGHAWFYKLKGSFADLV